MSVSHRPPVTSRPDEAPAGGHRGGRLLPRTWPALTGFAVLVLLWWGLTTIVFRDDPVLSAVAPQRALPAVLDLLQRGVLLEDTVLSLYRLLSGLLIATVIGIPVGLLVGLSRSVERAAVSPMQFLRMISPLSWTPIAIAVFGIGDEPVIFLIASAAVWPVIMNTVAGVTAMDPGHVMVARAMGATRTEMLRAVVLPSVQPHLLTGLRVALGTAWIVLVPAEMLGVRSGLGYQILNARDQLAYHEVMAVIVVIGACGFLLDSASRRLLAPRRPASTPRPRGR